MSSNVEVSVTAGIVAAVDAAIAAIRADHEGIPAVVFTMASGGGRVHGHFAAKSWRTRVVEGKDDTPEYHHELFLSGESLSRGGVGTFGTIVHELVHAYCEENEIQETSNKGRYHNAKFRAKAEEFGLEITQSGSIGWSVTQVPDSTQERYADVIRGLEEAITVNRSGSLVAASKEPAVKYEMQCPSCLDPVRVSKKWFERNTPTCSCGDYFDFLVTQG